MEAFEFDTFNENIEAERMAEEETSFIDNDYYDNDYNDDYDNEDNEYDKDIPIDELTKQDPFNPDKWADKTWANRNSAEDKRKRWKKTKKIEITRTRKSFFRNIFDLEVVMKDGPASKKLIKESKISVNEKTGKVNGILYNDVRVVVKKGKGFVLGESGKARTSVQEFSNLMEKARLEHSKTANGSIEEIVGNLPGTSNVNGIRANIIDRLEDEISISSDALDRSQLNDEELRELGGILATNNIVNLDAVEIADKYWNDKAEAEVDPRKKIVYKDISDVAKLKAEVMRLKNNLKPVSERVTEMIAEDDITKYEKFKKYAKNNLASLSAVAIAIAGIITTVVLAGRKGIVSAAKATGAIAKALAKLAKAALPVIAPLVNILATALTWGAKGMAWLAKNLWMLAIALAYILYKNRRKFYLNK